MSNVPDNFNPNDLLKEVFTAIGQLGDALEGEAVEQQVEIGATLWAITERANKTMEQAKDALRDEAERVLGGPGTHTFDGVGATQAMVSIPKPSLRLQKGADIDMLKKILGGDFERFFEEHVSYTPKSDFTERRAADSDPTHTAMLDKFVDAVPNTPRVTFRRMDHAASG